MNARISAFAAIAAVSLLASCGGGGGGGDDGGSVDTYQFHTAWVNYVTESGAKPFTLTGMSPSISPGTPFTGSGTATFGQLVSATFESRPALMKSISAIGTIVTATGQSIAYSSSATLYFDSNYQPLGAVADGAYSVVTGTPTIPQTAKVNDTGQLYVTTTYANSMKATVISTSITKYELLADTTSTGLLKIIETESHPQGWEISTYTATFRMTPDGQLTWLTEEFADWVSRLVLTY